MGTNNEYYITVDLSEISDDYWQFVYASQLYNTFFEIYAKFDAKVAGKKALVEKITFEIINYKGFVNIGFTDDGVRVRKEEDNEHDIAYVLEIHVAALSDKFMATTEGQQIGLQSGQKIALHRVLHPLEESEAWFDTEFIYRDGKFELPTEFKPGLLGFKKEVLDPSLDPENLILKGRCPYPRCHQKVLWPIFKVHHQEVPSKTI